MSVIAQKVTCSVTEKNEKTLSEFGLYFILANPLPEKHIV